MSLGIFLTTKKEAGGTYQYSLTLLDALKKTSLKKNLFIFSPKDIFRKRRQVKFFKIRRYLGSLYDGLINPLGVNLKKQSTFNVDLMIYPAPTTVCLKQKFPYIVCVHDLQHRINPQFPEVSQKGERQKREFLYKNCLKKATTIIAESETGKKHIQKFYKIPGSKIAVLPYIPPTYLKTKIEPGFLKKVRKKYSLPQKYIFYPAQFWPHKNHKTIIRALATLKKRGVSVKAVFVGQKMEKWGEYKRVMKLANKLKVKKQIKHLGYVKNKEMIALYKMAICLVMPTFFGPTNIPPLEAFYLGCPAITSSIEGIKEQVGKAAVLINPVDKKALAEAILKIYKDPKLRTKLKKAGYQKIKSWTAKDFAEKLERIIKKTKEKM